MTIGRSLLLLAALSSVAAGSLKMRSGDGQGALRIAVADNSATWELSNKTDEMTDLKTLQAKRSELVRGGGQFDITGECNHNSVAFTLDYFAEKGQDIHYVMNNRGDVILAARVDSNDAKSLTSSSNFNNEATIAFLNPKADVGGGANAFLFGLVSILNSAGRPDLLAKASILRIKILLTDGREPIVAINLQDPWLQEFFSRCGFPGPSPRTGDDAQPRSQAPTGTSRSATVTALQLNLRSGPGTTYGVVAKLNRGLQATVVDVLDSGWVELQVPADDGTMIDGFVNKDFLSMN
jgi:hypothetical protein